MLAASVLWKACSERRSMRGGLEAPGPRRGCRKLPAQSSHAGLDARQRGASLGNCSWNGLLGIEDGFGGVDNSS